MTEISDIMTTLDYGPAPEARDIVDAWLASRKDDFGHFIAGAFTDPGKGFDVMDPATGDRLAKVTQGTAGDVDAAVAAARAAQPGWAGLSPHDRARFLYAIARRLQQHARFLAVLEALDNGKPIRETRDIDIPLAARHFYHHAGWAELRDDEFPGARPVGVCGQIIPWNFPLLMLAWKVAPALAAGNTVVLKPAEYTPLSALAFAGICVEVGLPKGVVNIVTGDGATGAEIVAHPGIDKIAFTGSTEVGRLIRRETAGTGKALTLELGGKSPFVVFHDADLDAAVEGVVDAIWFNQGQVCCAGARILVAESVEAAFTTLLKRRMETLRVGPPLDKSTDVGAIVHPVQLARIRELVEQGVAAGASLHQVTAPEGCFYPPTIATGVEPASILAQEEIFGPVATLTSFRTPDDAVALANNTRYGLSASVWSENVNQAMEAASRIKAGVVWINCTNVFDAAAGFGGYRESGFGREGGRAGMRAYLTGAGAVDADRGEDDVPGDLDAAPGTPGTGSGIDRTAKLYIGGKQARPDSGYSYPVFGRKAVSVGLAGAGNRKDIRNAVEVAATQGAWSGMTGHARAQVLYYLAENLSARAAEFAERLKSCGASAARATREVDLSVERCFWYAAQADKFDGSVHQTLSRHMTVALNEPLGVMGAVCPTAHPLLGLVSLALPALATGNRVVVVPSQTAPLAATDLYQVFDTSDLPRGAISLVTGERDALAETLASHDGVDGLWYFGSRAGIARVEALSAGNLKQTWTEPGNARRWDSEEGRGRVFLEKATQIKTIWLPYGE
ncbi:aldehyde dehydrogenase family protein [Oceanibium sediminis]|uniref:aldehyde dehydrogenase family protein n=1 Tax=Oceanibium sediminis TaxID=2026339 RepID=UPI000DD442CD|nr:aldehyde dehydrogenase family protein [Oceanibium sediminis]